MIRVICYENDYSDAANVGGRNIETYKTFDIQAPEIEAWIKAESKWRTRTISGFEIIN